MSQLDLFEERLPNKPYCSDDLDFGLKIRPQASAKLKKYIQHNRPGMSAYIVYDCDYAGALHHVGQFHLPPPNMVATNRKNGHSHLFYTLKAPVCTSPAAHKKPLVLLAKIDQVLSEKLGADKGYVGLISKNPLTPEFWEVQEVKETPWELADFLDYLDLPAKLPDAKKVIGLGRNCTLFETARKLAYKQVLAYRLTNNREQFFALVLTECQSINLGFITPLALCEVKATAKSIAKWTWYKYTGRVSDQEFSKIQSKRALKSATVRASKSSQKRSQAAEMYATGATQQAIAKELGVAQSTLSGWLKKA